MLCLRPTSSANATPLWTCIQKLREVWDYIEKVLNMDIFYTHSIHFRRPLLQGAGLRTTAVEHLSLSPSLSISLSLSVYTKVNRVQCCFGLNLHFTRSKVILDWNNVTVSSKDFHLSITGFYLESAVDVQYTWPLKSIKPMLTLDIQNTSVCKH